MYQFLLFSFFSIVSYFLIFGYRGNSQILELLVLQQKPCYTWGTWNLGFCRICFFICLGSWRVDEVHRETPAYSIRKMRVLFQKSVASGVIDSSAYTRLKWLFFIDTLVFVWNWSRFPHRHAGNQGFISVLPFHFSITFRSLFPLIPKGCIFTSLEVGAEGTFLFKV